MNLLFDENLSPRLVALLDGFYPGSQHVKDAGLKGAPDARIWEYAETHGMVIVSKDDDFRQRSLVEGAPPKVVWLQVGNAGTAAIAALLQRDRDRVVRFRDDQEAAILLLPAPRG